MDNWLRSVSVLAMAFVGVVVMTLGLSIWILPNGSAVAQGGDPSASAEPSDDTPSVPTGPPTTEGGSLVVTGERPGTLALDRVNEDGGYAIVGDKGKVIFGGDPVEVTQVTFDGLDFYTDPGDCTLTPGEHNADAGVAWVDLECDEMRDIRDNATISVAGRVAVAASMVGLTADLPSAGGTLSFGETSLTAEWATFAMTVRPSRAGVDDDTAMSIGSMDPFWNLEFSWNADTDRLSLFQVNYGTGRAQAEPDACTIDRRVIGRHSPRHSMVEMTITCPSVDVPELGVVPISGTVIVSQVVFNSRF